MKKINYNKLLIRLVFPLFLAGAWYFFFKLDTQALKPAMDYVDIWQQIFFGMYTMAWVMFVVIKWTVIVGYPIIALFAILGYYDHFTRRTDNA